MRAILTTTERRHLAFIEILLKQHTPIHLKDIAKHLGCSVKILMHDIQHFDQLYPFVNLDRDKQYVSLTLDPSFTIGHVYAHTIRQSQNFQFLTYIFFHPQNSLEDILDHFNISQATLYRQLSIISKALQENFHLRLTSQPFRIEGAEVDIRQFYYLLFFESYDALEWPFPYIKEETVTLCCQQFAGLTQSHFHLGDIVSAKIRVAVNLMRLAHLNQIGCVEDSAHIQTLFPQIVQMPGYQALWQQLPETIQQMPTEKILPELFYPYISSHIIYNYETILRSPEKYQTINRQFMRLHSMTIALADKYKLQIDNVSQFIIRVHNSIEFHKSNLNQSYFLFDHYQEIFDYVDSQFPKFSQDLDREIKAHICDNQTMSQFQFQAVKRSILLNWEDLFFQLSDRKPINILVINKLSVTIADFYRKFLRFNLPKNANVMVWRHFPLNLEDLAHTSHEIIITNLKLPQIPGKKVLYMDSIFNHHDLQRIITAIQDVRVHQLHQGGLLYAPITTEQSTTPIDPD